jgi:signal peptidase I
MHNMESVYLKLLIVFALLAAVRLLLFARRVPASVRASVAEYTDSGIIASVVAIFVVTFLLQVSRVEGISMQPTLHAGDYTLVNKLTYRWHTPQRGDVVVFQAPDNPAADYIKRVIALPGETVEVRDGEVRVNGIPLKERYEYAPPSYDFAPVRVPARTVFVLGDNRNRSYDSHLWDAPFLKIDKIRGKAGVLLWPLGDAGEMPGKPRE